MIKKTLLSAAVLVCSLALLACSEGDEQEASTRATSTTTLAAATPTTAPASTATPAPVAAATEVPPPAAAPAPAAPAAATSTPAPPAPAAQATTPPPPVAQGSAPAVTFNVTARNLAFSTSLLTARAGAAVTVNFTNEDAAVAHDLSFTVANLNHGNTCNGPCKDTYTFTAPAAGAYQFFCTVHADMIGTFNVTP